MTFKTYKAANQYIDMLSTVLSISIVGTGNIMVIGAW